MNQLRGVLAYQYQEYRYQECDRRTGRPPDRSRGFGLRAGKPLKHAALLPVPGPGLPQPNPTIVIVEVNHPDLDHTVGSGRTVLETHFHPEHVAAGRIKLMLAVVTESVMLRSLDDRPHRRQHFLRRTGHDRRVVSQTGGGHDPLERGSTIN